MSLNVATSLQYLNTCYYRNSKYIQIICVDCLCLSSVPKTLLMKRDRNKLLIKLLRQNTLNRASILTFKTDMFRSDSLIAYSDDNQANPR